ncbi:hypothetical protein VitviT2T_020658 [Vitis vinifera]|uniref:Disease resistance N-terminal domain-containing protein n=1 Tax=Vitis vinifera TaxID=29760 RepID=A0ABY9D694_VITVI|nr:hypothetical protein VitviT2T_020658 [Vitis vinifera]
MADALLSASLQALFDRLASPELMNFIRGQKLSHELLNKLKRKLLVVHKVLNDAEMKQFSDPLVKEWLFQVKDAVYHAEDLLDEIATEALRCEIEAADSQPGGIHQVCNKFSTRVKAPFSNQSMESRVKEMIAKLEDIAQEKVELGLKEGDGLFSISRKFVLRVYLTFSQAGLACDSIPSTNVNGINYGWPLLGWVELQSDSSMFAWLASPELMNFIRGQKLSHELLNKLKRKLLVVHKVLNDAEMKQISDPLVKEWLFQVKDAVYHAEDLLDEIATEALRCEIEVADSQPGGIYQVWNKFSTRVKAPFSNQSMESRVKEMTAKLEDIAEEKEKLGLKEGDGWQISNNELQIGLTVDKENKEDCFCAVAIYTDNVLAEEISSLLWKTEQKACRQAQISLP